MKKFMKCFGLSVAFFGLMIGVSGQARAGILLDLVNPVPQTDTLYALSFIASDSTTTISIGGYQLPSYEQATNNGLYLNDAGPNLLGGTWDFTPAAFGSLAGTYNDGTSVPALNFGGVSEGYYDTFSQSIATTAGESYTLSFLFTEDYFGPSGFLVTTSASPVPEPSSLVLTGLAGLMGVGYARSRRKRTLLA